MQLQYSIEKKILIAVPSFDKAQPATFKSIYDMHKPYPCSFEYVKGYGAAKARNDIARIAVRNGYDYVMMIDSDIIVPYNALDLMLEGDADIVLGCYPRKNTITGQSELFLGGQDFTDDNNISYSLLNKMPKRINIKGGGMGCTLIKTSVFKNIQFPWFEYVEYSDGNVLSQDLKFCVNALESNLIIQADTRVRCGHIGSRPQYN